MNQRSKIEGKTSTFRDRNVDFIVRDIADLYNGAGASSLVYEFEMGQDEFFSLADPTGTLVMPSQGENTVIVPKSFDLVYNHVTTPYKITATSQAALLKSEMSISYEGYDPTVQFTNPSELRASVAIGIFATQDRVFGENVTPGAVGWTEDTVYKGFPNGYVGEKGKGLMAYISQNNAGTDLTLGDGTAILRVEYDLITL